MRNTIITALVALASPAAWAQCAPEVINSIVATTNSITVSWLLPCSSVPNSVELIQGGTSQLNFQNGKVLGTEDLQPNQNGGSVTAHNLAPATSYENLRLCSVYGGQTQTFCSQTFGAATLTPGGTPTPTITQVTPTQTSIYFAWNGNADYASYNVSIVPPSLVGIGQPNQYQTSGGSGGNYTFQAPLMLSPSTSYQIAVQGCNPGGWTSTCSQWATKIVTTAAPPPPAVLPPENLHTTSDSVSSIMVLWTYPPDAIAVGAEADTSRTPPWTSGSCTAGIQGGIQDNCIISGELYTYQVCLKYPDGTACGTIQGRSQVPPPTPAGCFGQSLTYADVEVMCYTYSGNTVTYDAVDPMALQRLDNGSWIVVDDGMSNSWDVPPPRLSAPFFQDTSFLTVLSPPQTATYRVVATNQWATSASAPFTVSLHLTVQPVTVPGLPSCGPNSRPYRPCIALRLNGPTGN